MKIVVGEGSCGIAAGAEKVRQALLKQDLNGAKLTIAGCIGMCYLEPIVDIYEDDQEVKRLVRVTENDAEKSANTLRRVTKALYLLFLFQMRIRNF